VRIGIDYRLAASSSRGMARGCREVVNALAQYDSENEYFLYADTLPASEESHLTTSDHVHIKVMRKTNYIIDEQCVLPYFAKRDNLDILWCPYNTFPLFLTKKCKLLVTIHDVIFLLSPEGKPSMKQTIGRLYRKLCVVTGKRRIDVCVTVSNYSTRQIKERLGIEAVCVPQYNLVSGFYQKALPLITREQQRGNFYFTVSGDAPSKNLRFLLEVFTTSLSQERLVIAGVTQNSPLRNEGGNNISFLDESVPDDVLIQRYRTCKAFVFPSLQEGFGIPVLEALVCGAPVAASNRASIPEVLNGLGVLFDPVSKDDFLKAIKAIDSFTVSEHKRQAYLARYTDGKNTAIEIMRAFNKAKERRNDSISTASR